MTYITPSTARAIIAQAQNTEQHDYHYSKADLKQFEKLITELINIFEKLERKVNKESEK